jgi:hypothetical protein
MKTFAVSLLCLAAAGAAFGATAIVGSSNTDAYYPFRGC